MEMPVFEAANPSAPTRDELVVFVGQAEVWIKGQQMILEMLEVDEAEWPLEPRYSIHSTVALAATIFHKVIELTKALNAYAAKVGRTKMWKLEQALQAWTSTTAQKIKIATPARYKGQRGDPAYTFMAGCENYRAMDPGAFATNQNCIRWALQLMDEKAGPWAIWQLQRMTQELDTQNRAPKELRKWARFKIFFETQFGDTGLKAQAAKKWREGIQQTGRAVDYFEEVENVLLHLGYGQDSTMIIDQVMGGLKEHLQVHFIEKDFTTLNDLKEEVIPYDAKHWVITESKGKGKA
jgi:hypothetical protein